MISWMQKHKKYLVVTIWISTIAFVGAGFVGWGAYKFGSGGDAVAEVGDVKITFQELQSRYASLYNLYNQLFAGKFDQQKAKELGLEREALKQLVQDALLENFAREYGLIVTDEEVARKIASMKVFWDKNGRFSKKLYQQVLAQNHMNPKLFETNLKKELLIQKVEAALKPIQTKLEFDTIATALYLADKIEYLPLRAEQISIETNESALQSYYEKHKNDYLSETKYKIAILEIPFTLQDQNETKLQKFYHDHRLDYRDVDGKILSFEQAKERVKEDLAKKEAKKEALRKYIAFKKGKIAASKVLEVTLQSDFPPALFEKLQKAKKDQVLKPILANDRYIVAKLLQTIEPTPLPYEAVKEQVKSDYIAQRRRELLEQKAKEMVANFHGRVTGYITREDIDQLKLLNQPEALIFLKELFTSAKRKGMIKVSENTIVLYKILDQKLGVPTKIEEKKAFISNVTDELKNSIQKTGLIKKLEQLYPIKIYKGF